MERVARCHCGQLRAIATGEPDRVYVCHCKACQRRTGSVIHNGSRWAQDQVRVEGEQKIYARQADSGFEIRFHFCPHCGSNVFWEGDRAPGWYGITVGSFADPGFPAPRFALFEEDMHPWIDITSAKEHFQKGLPSPPAGRTA